MSAIVWLEQQDAFPSPRFFVQDDPQLPEGLIALSASIDAQRLLAAYRLGIFPWYSAGQPVMWWCTSPRMVLPTKEFKVSRSLRKTIQQIITNPVWEIRVDTCFREVMTACSASKRNGQDGTWITSEIIDAYCALHAQGIAHSVEVWHNNILVGGLYGINLGQMFFGESMFTRVTDASKIALCALCQWCSSVHIDLIDCQQETQHLASLGAYPIPKTVFLNWLEEHIDLNPPQWNWNKTVLSAYN